MKSSSLFSSRLALSISLAMLFGAAWFMVKSNSSINLHSSIGTRQQSLETTSRSVAQVFQSHAKSFSDWQSTYQQATASAQSSMLDVGLSLAAQRSNAMMQLIRENPTLALNSAISLADWQALPEEIRKLVEEPFSTVADLSVLPVCSCNGSKHSTTGPHVVRLLREPGHEALTLFPESQRASMGSKTQLPVRGIRLGSVAAIFDEPLQPLASNDLAVARTRYQIANPDPNQDFLTGEPLGSEPIAALLGGQIAWFSSTSNLATTSQALASADATTSPSVHSGVVLSAMLHDPETRALNLPKLQFLSENSDWTITPKEVFMIRCDFEDFPVSSHPLPNANDYADQINNQVSPLIQCYSYGKTSIHATASELVIRLPHPASYYANNEAHLKDESEVNFAMLEDAKAAYLSARGLPEDSPFYEDYDIVGMRFVNVGMTIGKTLYTGLAEVHGTSIWIQGEGVDSVHAHEFGHNYGLQHSNFWDPPSGSRDPLDPTGVEIDYGDPFDVMGIGVVPLGCYHAEARLRLGWLDNDRWTDATTSATHRIFRIDHSETSGIVGVRVRRADDDYFWINYRMAHENDWLRSGAYLLWKQAGKDHSYLVDTTPESMPIGAEGFDRFDGAITIGRTFSDPSSNIHITALGRGGETPHEYLDVRVNIGPFEGNVPPTAEISGPSTLTTRQGAVFSANGSDANGDELSYMWTDGIPFVPTDHLGTGFTYDNNASVAMHWDSPGTYTVQCVVSDMKGHTITVSKEVIVTHPLTTWTRRTCAGTGHFNTISPGSSRVFTAGLRVDSSYQAPLACSGDGSSWAAGLYPQKEGTANRYMYGIYGSCWDGSKFLVTGVDWNGGWTGAISSSSDGSTWSRVYLGSIVGSLNAIAVGGQTYVAVGYNGQIVRSIAGGANGTWSTVSSGTMASFTGVAYGSGTFIVVGYTGIGDSCRPIVLSSPDGATWTDITSRVGFSEGACYFDQVAYLHDRFLFSGNNFGLRYSTDGGQTFTRAFPAEQGYLDNTPAMAYGDGMWLASGISHLKETLGKPVDLFSMNGTDWVRLDSPVRTSALHSAAFFNHTFIAVGDDHTIWQSDPIYPTCSSNFCDWRETHFPGHTSDSTPCADADGDGLVNLLEYQFGSNPLIDDSSSMQSLLPKAVRSTESPSLMNRLSLQFSIPDPVPSDFHQVVEVASSPTGPWTDLASKRGGAPWSVTGSARVVTDAAQNGRVKVTVADSQEISESPTRFLRLKSTPIE